MTSTMGSTSAGSTPLVTAPAGRRGFLRDVGAALWMPVRVLWSHWPVLFTLAVAGLAAREALVRAAVWVAGVNGILGFLVFLLAPVAALVAMVLMLRAVRPSLPSVRNSAPNGSLMRDLGSMLIPFVAFYLAFDLFQEDYRNYNDRLFNTYENVGAVLAGVDSSGVRVPAETSRAILPVVAVVVVAFALRWALDKWELTRRSPLVGLPAAYLETIWVVLGVLWLINPLIRRAGGWAGERRAWHAVLDWWQGLASLTGGLGQAYRLVDDWFIAIFPSGGFNRIFIVPITGLVAAAVVYNLNVPDALKAPPATGRRRWVRWAVVGATVALTKRFGPLIQGVRAMSRSGVVPIMFFCLCVAALQIAAQWLRKAEWAVIGPREVGSVQRGLEPSLEGFNDVLTFVLLVCVFAAAVDGLARRTGSAGLSAPAVPPPPVPDSPPTPGLPLRGAPGREPDVIGQGQRVVDVHRDGLGVRR